jgi:hypothetical protein
MNARGQRHHKNRISSFVTISRIHGNHNHRPPTLFRRVRRQLHKPDITSQRAWLHQNRSLARVFELCPSEISPFRLLVEFVFAKRTVVVRNSLLKCHFS